MSEYETTATETSWQKNFRPLVIALGFLVTEKIPIAPRMYPANIVGNS